LMERLPRLHHKGQAHIDYRHVIRTLVRKPGAFARYRWREELFPSLVIRRAYDVLRSRLGEHADTEYVRILHLAASRGEMVVEQTLCVMLDRDERFNAELKMATTASPAWAVAREFPSARWWLKL